MRCSACSACCHFREDILHKVLHVLVIFISNAGSIRRCPGWENSYGFNRHRGIRIKSDHMMRRTETHLTDTSMCLPGLSPDPFFQPLDFDGHGKCADRFSCLIEPL